MFASPLLSRDEMLWIVQLVSFDRLYLHLHGLRQPLKPYTTSQSDSCITTFSVRSIRSSFFCIQQRDFRKLSSPFEHSPKFVRFLRHRRREESNIEETLSPWVTFDQSVEGEVSGPRERWEEIYWQPTIVESRSESRETCQSEEAEQTNECCRRRGTAGDQWTGSGRKSVEGICRTGRCEGREIIRNDRQER